MAEADRTAQFEAVVRRLTPLLHRCAASARVTTGTAYLLLVHALASKGVARALCGGRDACLKRHISSKSSVETIRKACARYAGADMPPEIMAGIGDKQRRMLSAAAKLVATLALFRLAGQQVDHKLELAASLATKDLLKRFKSQRGGCASCPRCTVRGRLGELLPRLWGHLRRSGEEEEGGAPFAFLPEFVKSVSDAFAKGAGASWRLDLEQLSGWVGSVVERPSVRHMRSSFATHLDGHIALAFQTAWPCEGAPAQELQRGSKRAGAGAGASGHASADDSMQDSSDSDSDSGYEEDDGAPDVPHVERLAAALRDAWTNRWEERKRAAAAQERPGVQTPGSDGRPAFASIFSGLGAFALALEMAGMRLVQTCECDEGKRRVLEHWWPTGTTGVDHGCSDVGGLVLAEGITCVVMGPPCTDLSSVGKREGLFGRESGLVADAFAAIQRAAQGGHGPEWVVVEQVDAARNSGSALGTSGPGPGPSAVQAMVAALHAMGYGKVCTRCWSPNEDAGIPVRRHRVFLVAARTHDARQVLFRPVPRPGTSATSGPPAFFFTPPRIGPGGAVAWAEPAAPVPRKRRAAPAEASRRAAIAIDLSCVRAVPSGEGAHTLPCLTGSNGCVAVLDGARSRSFLISPEIRERAAGLPAGFSARCNSRSPATASDAARVRALGSCSGVLPVLYIGAGIVHLYRGPGYAGSNDPLLAPPLDGSLDPRDFSPDGCLDAASRAREQQGRPPQDEVRPLSWTFPAWATWSEAALAGGGAPGEDGDESGAVVVHRRLAKGLAPGGWFGGQPLTPLGRWITLAESNLCGVLDHSDVDNWGSQLRTNYTGDPDAATAALRRAQRHMRSD
ncbi:unnamed protein product [Pedinophyceae sp. YPF-701]|nr:unnamed protein product [Pedinophyceae sp. YPF-701]